MPERAATAAARRMGVLVDLGRCMGCRGCQVACKNWNQLDAEETTFFAGPGYQNPGGLSDRTFTFVQYFELAGKTKPVDLLMIKRQCMHCNEPGCASACIVGALAKTEAGPVVYDDEKCMGCRYCMVACPFGVPTYEWSKPLPLVRKCTFCADRQAEGLAPACATTCPSQALLFGPREALLAEAYRRIAASRGKLVEHVYGEHEMGGTSWMYLSPVEFGSIGFRTDLGTEAASVQTETAMTSVPGVFGGVTATMGGLWWLGQRKLEVARAETRKAVPSDPEVPPAREHGSRTAPARAAGEEVGSKKESLGLVLGRALLFAVAALGMGVVAYRCVKGLGASTNLSNRWPWGLWIAFDDLCGVALAAGGLVVAAMVHVLGLERYRPVARPAVLTAFLGYCLVILGLLVDLGQPHRIFHVLWMGNPHSVLFGVAGSALLYTTVLALEFAPVVLDRWNLAAPIAVLGKAQIPLVILGIGLATLHQSALGAVFLAAGHRLHPLWYTPALPVLFLISAVSAGLAVVIVESTVSARLLGRSPENHVLSGLAGVLPWVLGLYLAIRMGDLARTGRLDLLGAGTTEAKLFWIEIGVGVSLPILMLGSRASRSRAAPRLLAAVLVLAGVCLNRFDVALAGMRGRAGAAYFPHWMELAVTAGLVAMGLLAFGFAVRNFQVFPSQGRPAPAWNRRAGAPAVAE